MKNVKWKLRTKFSLTILVIVLIFGTVNIFLVNQYMLNSIDKEQNKRIINVAHILSSNSVQPILYEDHVSLQRLVNETKEMDDNISYCFILDNTGKPLAHTFQNGFPVMLSNANMVRNNEEGYRIQEINDGEETYLDIAFPILENQIGTVRVGMKEKYLTQQVRQVTYVMVAMVLTFLTVGIIGAFISAKFITKPITRIVQVADSFKPDKSIIPKIKIKNRDEIGYLAQKFNQMFKRLLKSEEEKNKTFDALLENEKLASIGKVASGVAHEINNPLDGIQNCLSRLKKTPENLNQNIAYLNLMENALKRIDRVTGQLLDLSRKERLSFQPTNLNILIKDIMPLVKYSIVKNKIKLKTDYDKKLPNIFGDADRLHQVFLNLLLNSIDAMPDGGELILKTYTIDGYANIEISDTGSGIKESDIQKIFEPFYTTKQTGKGTGLGLTVSLNIVKEHNGKILIKTHNKKNTTFLCSFPVDIVKDKI